MALDIEKEIKIVFIAAFIIDMIFGLVYLISPEWWYAAVNWPFSDPVAARIVGSLLTALAIINLKAYKEADQWEKIENIVIYSTIWCIIGAISMIMGYIMFNLPPGAIINIVLLIVFAILMGHIYIQKRK